ncbi:MULTISPECIES: uracil-DNA glycosylase family protein [unclassified Microbulbifer]|uniref:uracil-DNA glycosylase family protein n=1 Tax=unclassified Microbulbifer TaxID=2619833 RepID=UPI001E63625D|nr:uracil-DNA glycosylase family protein [Microbulbifer sp. YPW16]UHQ55149.1 uracil-DNA glycosylase family protein [Microbulbifer sp. YPW16]
MSRRIPLQDLLREVRACRLCEDVLPLGPNPVLRAAESARLLIVGQAPGTKVHETGIPWNDPSGDRLRDWLAIDRDTFYDESRIAIIPMGFCYPGRGKGGDLPPRPECAAAWHARLLELLPDLQLTLLVGQYAQRYYLPHWYGSITENVRHYADALPAGYFPLPHPSPRNTLWLRQRPWFEKEVVPELRRQVKKVLP